MTTLTRSSLRQPLAEVFGFPISNQSPEAVRHRNGRLCPYGNKIPLCTKDKATDPLGVCSVFEEGGVAVVCPVRFREGWIIAKNAAEFFFPSGAKTARLTEVPLRDNQGHSVGNVDLILVDQDDKGLVKDFGSVEVQAVYISGNERRPFNYYMQDCKKRTDMDWRGETNFPRPDYLSSSRKRLVPQLLYKGTILKAWGKKQAVVLHKGFYATLPSLPQVPREKADIAWFIYDLVRDQQSDRYHLKLDSTVFTAFLPALERITTPPQSSLTEFQGRLQEKLDSMSKDNTRSRYSR